MICRMLDFGTLDRRFLLFDTFNGIPSDRVADQEKGRVTGINALYSDVYDITSSRFSTYSNVELVRGVLPEALDNTETGDIAYLSIDLNYAAVEIQCIRQLWDRVSPGGVVLLDDYAWKGHEPQKQAWDAWAIEVGTAVLTVPTGQGIIVK